MKGTILFSVFLISIITGQKRSASCKKRKIERRAAQLGLERFFHD